MSNEETVTIELPCGEADWLKGYLADADSVTAKRIHDRIPQTSFKIGDRFRAENGFFSGHCYMLASVGASQVCLIDIHRGERWSAAVEIDHVHRITMRDFERIAGKRVTFTKV